MANPSHVLLCNVSGSVSVLTQRVGRSFVLPSVLGSVSLMTQCIWNGFGDDVMY